MGILRLRPGVRRDFAQDDNSKGNLNGTAEAVPLRKLFQSSLRDSCASVWSTQHCVLGYYQSSLRD